MGGWKMELALAKSEVKLLMPLYPFEAVEELSKWYSPNLLSSV